MGNSVFIWCLQCRMVPWRSLEWRLSKPLQSVSTCTQLALSMSPPFGLWTGKHLPCLTARSCSMLACGLNVGSVVNCFQPSHICAVSAFLPDRRHLLCLGTFIWLSWLAHRECSLQTFSTATHKHLLSKSGSETPQFSMMLPLTSTLLKYCVFIIIAILLQELLSGSLNTQLQIECNFCLQGVFTIILITINIL